MVILPPHLRRVLWMCASARWSLGSSLNLAGWSLQTWPMKSRQCFWSQRKMVKRKKNNLPDWKAVAQVKRKARKRKATIVSNVTNVQPIDITDCVQILLAPPFTSPLKISQPGQHFIFLGWSGWVGGGGWAPNPASSVSLRGPDFITSQQIGRFVGVTPEILLN